MIFSLDNFCRSDVLNIFTDASLRSDGQNVWTCGGALAFEGKEIIDRAFRIFGGQSSNYAELKAIRIGVSMAVELCKKKQYSAVNLFSDSQISILGIRDRLFNWRVVNDKLVGYANKQIKNQDIILDIVQVVNNGNLRINFWHQKGHVDIRSMKAKEHAYDTFVISNRPAGATDSEVEPAFINYISTCNDMIDHYSREQLYDISIRKAMIVDPFYFTVSTDYNKALQTFNQLISGGQQDGTICKKKEPPTTTTGTNKRSSTGKSGS